MPWLRLKRKRRKEIEKVRQLFVDCEQSLILEAFLIRFYNYCLHTHSLRLENNSMDVREKADCKQSKLLFLAIWKKTLEVSVKLKDDLIYLVSSVTRVTRAFFWSSGNTRCQHVPHDNPHPLKELCRAIWYLFKKLKRFLRLSKSKNYSGPYLGIETVSSLLLPRMARMDMWLKVVTKRENIIFAVIVLFDEICLIASLTLT